jgi:hypothetical protein
MTARLIVLWDTPPRDPAEFRRRSQEIHIPLAMRLPGLRRSTHSRNAAFRRGRFRD